MMLELLIAAAAIALHAQDPKKPFRHRDLKFFAELFANWIEYGERFSATRIHNNQIARLVEKLEHAETFKRQKRKDVPEYILTPFGLLHCLRLILAPEDYSGQQYIYFKVYFLSNYGEKIRAMIRSAETQVPAGLRLEAGSLLDCRRLIQHALINADADKRRLEARIEAAIEMPKLVRRMEKNRSWQEIVEAVEEKFPYELNAARPLTELCAALPQEIAYWELTEGSQKRVEQIWQPLYRGLLRFIGELKSIEAGLK